MDIFYIILRALSRVCTARSTIVFRGKFHPHYSITTPRNGAVACTYVTRDDFRSVNCILQCNVNTHPRTSYFTYYAGYFNDSAAERACNLSDFAMSNLRVHIGKRRWYVIVVARGERLTSSVVITRPGAENRFLTSLNRCPGWPASQPAGMPNAKRFTDTCERIL